MNKKRFTLDDEENGLCRCILVDGEEMPTCEICDLLNEQQITISALKEENEQLRLELETHKHPLWSTREAERKLSEVTNNLANEVKKNGLLNEEINQLRIENMRLKKKGGDNDE